MGSQVSNGPFPASKPTWTERWWRDWDDFWFRPSDPTLLCAIRLGTGLLAVYTMIAFSFELQNFVGPHAWLDLESRMEHVRQRPMLAQALSGKESPLSPPRNDQERAYLKKYVDEFGYLPPGPHPKNDDEMRYLAEFRRRYNVDLRLYGLPPPRTEDEKEFAETFTAMFKQPPAPPYPRNSSESEKIVEYMQRYLSDPNRLVARGMPLWSLWFYVTDPVEMQILQGLFIAVSFLFLIGFCTRITAALTWFAMLNYFHRAPEVLFGVDTMMTVLLLYLMIGPSGAALSVDRLLARWWSQNKLRVINGWRSMWKRAPLAATDIAPAHYTPQPQPRAGATVALRLLQIHLCIIYLVAGLAKLLGPAWWNGTAVWGAIANFEFAPMHYAIYNDVLRFIGHNEIVFYTFLLVGTYFTLFFEIGYAFLIWQPRFRWFMLGCALLLHGFIGTLMGLKTFTLIMVVMNMAFLRDNEIHWMVRQFRWALGLGQPSPPAPASARVPVLERAR